MLTQPPHSVVNTLLIARVIPVCAAQLVAYLGRCHVNSHGLGKSAGSNLSLNEVNLETQRRDPGGHRRFSRGLLNRAKRPAGHDYAIWEIVKMKTVPKTIKVALAGVRAIGLVSTVAYADDDTHEAVNCQGLPTYGALKAALASARNQANGGFNLDMWGTVVNRDVLSAPSRSRERTEGMNGLAAAPFRRKRHTPQMPSACRGFRSPPRISTPPFSPAAPSMACNIATRWIPNTPTRVQQRNSVRLTTPWTEAAWEAST
jgi:hypothetical protein